LKGGTRICTNPVPPAVTDAEGGAAAIFRIAADARSFADVSVGRHDDRGAPVEADP